MTKKDIFIARSTAKFGNQFDYSRVEYTKLDSPVIIICKTHGEFSIQPKNHLRSGYGCPHCAKQGMTNKMLLPWEDVLKRFKEVHGDRYDYSQVEYTGMFNPIKIICKDHGPFMMLPVNHEAGQNCRACHLKLPKGESAAPRARRNNERVNVARLEPVNFVHLNMFKVPRP